MSKSNKCDGFPSSKVRAAPSGSSGDDGKALGPVKLDAVEVTLVAVLMAFLIIVVGVPLAAWWWMRDAIRKKFQESEREQCPSERESVTSIMKEDRECPY